MTLISIRCDTHVVHYIVLSVVIHIEQVYNSKIEFQINNFALKYEFFPL